MKLAIVVQRYAADINGGAELHDIGRPVGIPEIRAVEILKLERHQRGGRVARGRGRRDDQLRDDGHGADDGEQHAGNGGMYPGGMDQ